MTAIPSISRTAPTVTWTIALRIRGTSCGGGGSGVAQPDKARTSEFDAGSTVDALANMTMGQMKLSLCAIAALSRNTCDSRSVVAYVLMITAMCVVEAPKYFRPSTRWPIQAQQNHRNAGAAAAPRLRETTAACTRDAKSTASIALSFSMCSVPPAQPPLRARWYGTIISCALSSVVTRSKCCYLSSFYTYHTLLCVASSCRDPSTQYLITAALQPWHKVLPAMPTGSTYHASTWMSP